MMVTTPQEFGTAWKVAGNYTCSDGCGSSCPQCTNERPARARCDVIQASDGPLSFCHELVNPAPYFSNCVFDVCASRSEDQDLLCRAIDSYVSACQSANVQIYPWRQNTTCSNSTIYSSFKTKKFRKLVTIRTHKGCPYWLPYPIHIRIMATSHYFITI